MLETVEVLSSVLEDIGVVEELNYELPHFLPHLLLPHVLVLLWLPLLFLPLLLLPLLLLPPLLIPPILLLISLIQLLLLTIKKVCLLSSLETLFSSLTTPRLNHLKKAEVGV